MQRACVASRRDDWLIRESRAIANELVRKFRLDLALVDAWLDDAEDAPEPVFGEMAGLPRELQFRLRLDRAQAMHQTGKPLIVVQRIPAQRVCHEASIASFDFHHRALV